MGWPRGTADGQGRTLGLGNPWLVWPRPILGDASTESPAGVFLSREARGGPAGNSCHSLPHSNLMSPGNRAPRSGHRGAIIITVPRAGGGRPGGQVG